MATKTFIIFETRDAQGYEEFVKIRIKDSAFGTGIPTTAKIDAIADAMFGDDKISDQQLVKYSVVVENDAPTPVGGNGDVATATAARTRNDIQTSDWPFSIPGLNKANVAFDPTNPNAIATTGTLWDDLRTALTDAAIAWGDPSSDTYVATDSDHSLQVASAFQGRRAPKRVR